VKSITELVKIVLLLIIAVFLGIGSGIFHKPTTIVPEPNSISDTKSSIPKKERKEDLKKIMEHTLSSLFKFPESVRFKNTNLVYKRLFHDAGINVDTSKELELATLCGHYSAQNAMGVYGAFERFYAAVAVNNEKRGISGELWFSNDGSIQKLYSLDSKVPLEGEEDEFNKLFLKNCGDIDKAHMGAFSGYEIGYEAIGVKYYSEALDKLSQYPDLANTIQICMQSGASTDYCIAIEQCQRFETLQNDMKEFCSIQKEICSDNNSPNVCEEKIIAVYKEKNSKNKK
jgi:hypothetical protein